MNKKLIKRIKKLSEKVNDYDYLWSQWIICGTLTSPNKLENPTISDSKGEKIKYVKWNTHNLNADDTIKDYICLCSNTCIKKCIFLENLATNERCVVGNCCVKNFMQIESKKYYNYYHSDHYIRNSGFSYNYFRSYCSSY